MAGTAPAHSPAHRADRSRGRGREGEREERRKPVLQARAAGRKALQLLTSLGNAKHGSAKGQRKGAAQRGSAKSKPLTTSRSLP